MKIVAIYSRQFKPLCDEWFLATLPPDMEPVLIESPADSSPGFEFQTKTYRHALDFKVCAIRDVIRDHPGEIICFSDVDVQFFGSFRREILDAIEAGYDVAGMREAVSGGMNGGFFAVRCSPHAAAFWEELAYADKTGCVLYEQDAMNAFLDEGMHGLASTLLPDAFWASHRYLTFKEPEPAGILVNHATGWMDKPAELARMRAKYARR